MFWVVWLSGWGVVVESRSSWNPAPPSSERSLWPSGEPQSLVVHWVGGGPMGLHLRDHADCRTSVRSIQRYEMTTLPGPYIDIAYNVLACPHGILIEGRGLQYKGAANGGNSNGTSASVCILVGKGDVVTPGHYDAVNEARKLFPGRLLSHRDVNSTACPGDEIAAWVLGHSNPVGALQTPLSVARTPSPSPGGGLVAIYLALHRMASTIKIGRTLVSPTSGHDVAEVQLFLVGACGQLISVDGKFGPATVVAVKNFQRFFKLSPDGVFGPVSRRAAAYVLSTRFP